MNSLSILFIGRESGTARHRAMALRRLGHLVFHLDPHAFLPKSSVSGIWIWRTGGLFLEGYIRERLLASLPPRKFDLVYVDGGELIGPSLVRELKKRYRNVVNYNIDDPFGGRDGQRWRIHLRAVPHYDLVVVVRECNVSEAYAAGAANVLRVQMSADEVAHAPRVLTPADHSRWSAEVIFIGTWMPERGPFLARMVERGVPVSIYGERWQRAREYGALRSHWRGVALYNDDQYAKAIQCSKVSLGLLSKGNRDLSTTRSFEIPSLGGVLCAERTPEHLALYQEDEEAVFWGDADECSEKCLRLLGDEELRKRLGQNARARNARNNNSNEQVLARILERVMQPGEVRVAAAGEASRIPGEVVQEAVS